jgi:flagellar biosynthesis protein FliR
VCFVVDAAIGIVNKAVPQMPAFLVGLPAKMAMGLLALALSLPTLVSAVQSGVRSAFEILYRMLAST